MLQKCSEGIESAFDEQRESQQDSIIENNHETITGVTNDQLESIKDLIHFDHVYHKSQNLGIPFQHMIVSQPLSPLSCQSDSGYESSPSPSSSLDDIHSSSNIESEIEWEPSFNELFPNLA